MWVLSHLLQYNLVHALHLSDEALLCVPPRGEARLVGIRRWAFLVLLPLLWNTLSRDAYLPPSLTTYRSQVKTQSFRWVFY